MYLLKFIYGVLLFPPGLFIVLLLVLALWGYRRRGKEVAKALLAFTLLFYLCSTGLVADAVIHSLEARYSPSLAPSGDVIIVLGGGATLDTPNVSGLGHVSGYAANRLLTAAQLYKKLGVPIIVSGGQVFMVSGVEADIGKTILIGLGIPADQIIAEPDSLNTTENAQNSAALVKAHGFTRPILVTSAFHMERSVRQFEKAGLKVDPYPTDYLTNISPQFHYTELWPSAAASQRLVLGLKEYLGIAAVRWY